MTTIGYGDKAPKTTGGRLLALLWMLIAMGITASLTARITSILVLDQGIQPLQVQQLKTMAIGSLANTTAANYLQQEQLNFQTFFNAGGRAPSGDGGPDRCLRRRHHNLAIAKPRLISRTAAN